LSLQFSGHLQRFGSLKLVLGLSLSAEMESSFAALQKMVGAGDVGQQGRQEQTPRSYSIF
jgi:hypothetical protein